MMGSSLAAERKSHAWVSQPQAAEHCTMQNLSRMEAGVGGMCGVRPTESPKIRLSPAPYIKGNFLNSDGPLGSERNFRVHS